MKSDPNKNDTKRQRSPDYPFYSLAECVKYIEILKKKQGLAKLPKKTALTEMGFDLSGQTVWRASSAITGFGLLAEEGPSDNRMYKFTDIGQTIVTIKDNNETLKIKALQKAALNYEIIQQIRVLWDTSLPSDDVIKSELIRRGFTERAAARFVSVLRETYIFAKFGTAFLRLDDNEDQDTSELREASGEHKIYSAKVPKGYEEYTLSLSLGKEVKLLTSDSLTKDDIDFMLLWVKRLDLSRSQPSKNGEDLNDHNDN